jgi:hypothetical protein
MQEMGVEMIFRLTHIQTVINLVDQHQHNVKNIEG